MTEPRLPDARHAKRRQYLLLGGIISAIVGATWLSVRFTERGEDGSKHAKPTTTHILAPGAQVDPRDAWRGQADAHLKDLEQQAKSVSQRNRELETQTAQMLERLQRLERRERSGLTPLPPPPVMAPAEIPRFGPDTPTPASADPLLQRLPPSGAAPRAGQVPPLLPPAAPSGAGGRLGTGVGSPPLGQPLQPASIVTLTLTEPSPKTPAPQAVVRDTRRYLPSGSFTRALLLGGLDAPTGGQAQRNPQPVLLRLLDHAVLPNHFRSRIKECFVIGAGYGDVSAERAYIRTEALSCVTRQGVALDVPLKGYVAGEDGKAGMRGRLVSKQGQILANALLAGVASGIGHAFQQGATTLSVSPLGTTGSIDPEKALQAGLGSGVGKALDRLAQYYITLAEKVFPVIEVDAGRTVDVVVTQGLSLDTSLDAGPGEGLDPHDPADAELPHLADRAQRLTRPEGDDH